MIYSNIDHSPGLITHVFSKNYSTRIETNTLGKFGKKFHSHHNINLEYMWQKQSCLAHTFKIITTEN